MVFLYRTITVLVSVMVTLKAEELSDINRAYVAVHNHFRSKADPPASNMRKMELDIELETIAKEWASKCLFKSGYPKNNYKGNLGQNIYWSTNPDNIEEKAIKSWHKGVVNYSLKNNTCEADQRCGTYTQLVWANSYKVGCGLSDMCDDDGKYTLNNEAGNYLGQRPYKQGTCCSTCGVGWTKCSDNLCLK